MATAATATARGGGGGKSSAATEVAVAVTEPSERAVGIVLDVVDGLVKKMIVERDNRFENWESLDVSLSIRLRNR